NKLFLDLFDEGVPGAPDIQAFANRLQLFMDHAGRRDLRHYPTGARAASVLHGTGKLEVASRSFEYLQEFCDRNPDLEAAAMDTWIKGYEEHNSLGLGSAKTSAFRSATEQSVRRAGMSKVQQQDRRKRINHITETLWWRTHNPPSYGGAQSLKSRLSGLGHIPFERIGEEELQALRGMLEEEETIKPSHLNRFISDSLRATLSFMSQVTAGDKKLEEHPVGKLSRLAEHQEASGGEPISYQWLIKAANVITPALAADSGLDLEKLDVAAFEDYPKAVDRLISYSLAASRASLAARGQTELYLAAADCIKLAARHATEQKLSQTVLTLGDIVLRYPDLSAAQQRTVMERLQVSRGRVGTLAVKSAYQQVRRSQKHHSRYNRKQPGYGIFS
ncbi:MAG TPA: hypothetical protein VD706_02635, partial [Candidatus Saccharimonadales bacterium]|nr:hypothetical protein [Candidatus Saccharimonadales bacterium]